jgi:hypothetical protein
MFWSKNQDVFRYLPFNLQGGYGFFLKKYSDFGGGKNGV